MPPSSKEEVPEMDLMCRDLNMRLRMARAAELASFNLLEEAEKVLCHGGISRASVAELDLLARIHVQQGRFEEARARWEEVISRAGEGQEKSRACLEALKEFKAYRDKVMVITWRIALAILALITSLGVGLLVAPKL
ncbi:hypothetical protein [Roseimicrobium sp. ORNL1]|uniref:hypothetical protein n=1 Tax=Roseimicrobium sp. ORNL1 TaxID=2711231 RepID=UPI0013E1078A|nr:hypothetical protein [Roseimicrobium sp. ORNL1]QIF00980.1 hypothetical protein G5S37_05430 [Roseimicrobium sp. ORNL1]